ncbi:hypothetical protein NM688_g7252 [Phlebia brevispora]|uniref:Uncharacterized protein n=1 Tax=Phlebia brevispora TaxID=194682 RepID=A0ACC1S7L3_9APHY|nr:hypothetical protein NM688_g7252 [Phlebia brevispora]
MPLKLPRVSRAVLLKRSPPERKPVYHDIVIEERPIPALKQGEVLVKIGAAAYNHRDLWIRKGQYPGIAFDTVLGADGAGTVVASADNNDSLLNKRVFLVPSRGWEKDPDGPETKFASLGGGNIVPIGTFSQYVKVERDQIIETPDHLDDVHIAAWPLGGVTAWRASVVNANVKKGDNVFITGIGGGVALQALQICLALGANVYVSSGNEEKIQKAVALGAKGGVNYKQGDWPTALEELLIKNGGKEARLSAVIDSGGGEIMAQVGKILKHGGKVVVYGMTASPKISFTMREVLKNQRLLGSSMGSHQDLIDATKFLAEHKIEPVVSHVLDGFEAADEGFNLVQRGDHFGKIVIKVHHDQDPNSPSKL